jgi:hypothetical protein
VKNSLQVAGGAVGAVVGFIATLLILELVGFGNRPIPRASSCHPAGMHSSSCPGGADHFPFNPPAVSQKITITVR